MAVRDRSGKECENETLTLLVLFDGYCELVWKGMEYFGVGEEREYYKDNYLLNKEIVTKMQLVLDNKSTIEIV